MLLYVFACVYMCLWVRVGVYIFICIFMILEDGKGIWEDNMRMLSFGVIVE